MKERASDLVPGASAVALILTTSSRASVDHLDATGAENA
jgi:hypothetical protein